MFVIKRKKDGKYLRRSPSWVSTKDDRRWTDSILKARVFGRIEDAKQSVGWTKEGTYTKPRPSYKGWNEADQYRKEVREYEASFVPIPEDQRSVELVKVYLIPEDVLKG